jgi:hypothetical protein
MGAGALARVRVCTEFPKDKEFRAFEMLEKIGFSLKPGRCVTDHRTQRPGGQVGPPGPHPAQPSSLLDPGGEHRPISPPLAPLIAQLVRWAPEFYPDIAPARSQERDAGTHAGPRGPRYRGSWADGRGQGAGRTRGPKAAPTSHEGS